MNKLEFYTKLQAKLDLIAAGQISLADYQKEVAEKLDALDRPSVDRSDRRRSMVTFSANVISCLSQFIHGLENGKSAHLMDNLIGTGAEQFEDLVNCYRAK